ncbi:MAG TPA: hypothetical protein VIT20_04390 [Propionibacteriaceae bacterium]
MASKLWTSILHRVVAKQVDVRTARTDLSPATATDELPGELGLRLAGDAQPVDRLVIVRPRTVAVVFEDGEPPRVRLPGDYLKPRLLPKKHPRQVLVLSTAPITVDVTIERLTTLDGQSIEQTTIRLTLQLSEEGGFGWLSDLAAEFGTGLETQLLERVHREVVTAAQAAIRMNRSADVRGMGIQRVLEDRWLPATFAGGALTRRNVAVLDPAVEPEPHPAPARAPEPLHPAQPAPPSEPRAPVGTFRLNLDRQLVQLWQEHAGTDLQGISGVKVLKCSTVIAVPATAPGAYETTRLQEAFGKHFGDRHVHVMSAPAGSYPDLVRSWFRQVEGSPGRLVSVESVDQEVLRIKVDQTLASSEASQHGLLVGSQSDREALRLLVPHNRIVFVRADPVG